MFLSAKAIKEIKKELKEQNLLLSYKNKLKIKKMSFLLTKISIIFNSSIPLKKMYEIEESFIKNKVDQIFWSKQFKKISIYFEKPFDKCNWESFGNFIFFVWNQYIFKNKKHRLESIYNYDNFNDINSFKAHEYTEWVNSMFDSKSIEFNVYIRKVLKIL